MSPERSFDIDYPLQFERAGLWAKQIFAGGNGDSAVS
jgi:hypothetical protein